MLHVPSKRLRRAEVLLKRQNIEVFLPKTVVTQSTFTDQGHLENVFLTKMFIKLSKANLHTPPWLLEKSSLVYRLDTPISINDEELTAIALFLRRHSNVFVRYPIEQRRASSRSNISTSESRDTDPHLFISSLDCFLFCSPSKPIREISAPLLRRVWYNFNLFP